MRRGVKWGSKPANGLIQWSQLSETERCKASKRIQQTKKASERMAHLKCSYLPRNISQRQEIWHRGIEEYGGSMGKVWDWILEMDFSNAPSPQLFCQAIKLEKLKCSSRQKRVCVGGGWYGGVMGLHSVRWILVLPNYSVRLSSWRALSAHDRLRQDY